MIAFGRIGRHDLDRQQMAQRVHGHVDLAALLALVAVVAFVRPALAGGLEGALSKITALVDLVCPGPLATPSAGR